MPQPPTSLPPCVLGTPNQLCHCLSVLLCLRRSLQLLLLNTAVLMTRMWTRLSSILFCTLHTVPGQHIAAHHATVHTLLANYTLPPPLFAHITLETTPADTYVDTTHPALLSPPPPPHPHTHTLDKLNYFSDRFMRAVAELQFLGFVQQSKRKTDHVQRMTWGTC